MFLFDKRPLLACIFCIAFASCNHHQNTPRDRDYSFLLHEWNATITDVMVGDGFSPLLASRTYAYPNIAAYAVLTQAAQDEPSPVNRLNGL
ncbi:MAG TPA: hypothetical protein VNJ07_04945, partial [Chitinophagales bacterium]|nr:hypothetical protein [Chitinophagales bacterium]